MDKLVYIFFLIILLATFLNVYHVRKLTKLFKNTLTNVQQNADETFDKRELTSYELERLEREEEFDERINRLKEELAEQHNVIRKGTTADELHPLVHNLPHDSVQTKYDVYPDVEVSE